MTAKLARNSAYTLIYSFGEHPYLGFLLEPHVVRLNDNGSLSFSYTRVFSNTLDDYPLDLDETDRAIVALLDQIEPNFVIKKHHKKNIRATDYFATVFDSRIFEFLRPKLETKILKVLALIGKKPLYLMSKDGYPADTRLTIAPEPATVLFHFRRNELETRYFPTIKFQGQRIEFMYRDAQILINQQAWLLLDQVLYHFDQPLEGKKLSPFLQKRYISVPRSTERKYFEMFVCGLIEKHHVYAEGFDIKTEMHEAAPVLRFSASGDGREELHLYFQYDKYLFSAGTESRVTVKMEYDASRDHYTFQRIKRSVLWEEKQWKKLERMGLRKGSDLLQGLLVGLEEPNVTLSDWLVMHFDTLNSEGFKIDQSRSNKIYHLQSSVVDLQIKEGNDWFDVYAVARFGTYEIPFLQLKDHILDGRREFVLPGGEIALIPQAWFARYSQLFQFSGSKSQIRLKKHHLGLLKEISENTTTSLDQKLQELTSFEGIEDLPMPKNFRGVLRPYQMAGYQWFVFLKKYHFGGCLADDMGLGKTIQTLALLQREKELAEEAGTAFTALIVMPTSLIYNWVNEAQKFTPQLKIVVHTGNLRSRSVNQFESADIIISTYGIIRMDAEWMGEYCFDYLILDESQNIKNPSSKAFKSVKKLRATHRLALSGTPIENTVSDLWSQMSFLNPGLLGSFKFFQEQFVHPIEKKSDEEKADRLQALIKPFLLRRTKEQVASELPPKSEQIIYCEMTDGQKQRYEEVKSEYRNTILEGLTQDDTMTPQMTLLQGLMRLRQIANHPKLNDPAYQGSSGKMEEVLLKLENVRQRANKILIFSQFVQHLKLIRDHFDREQIKYAYLDGSTSDRASEVSKFSTDPEVRIFLISIKAGGVGLNLTEADYVFILDPWWNPAVEQQAIDRTHRIGQTKNVFIYKFISVDSVEEKIVALQERKAKYAESLIRTEENFFKSLTAGDIRELLE